MMKKVLSIILLLCLLVLCGCRQTEAKIDALCPYTVSTERDKHVEVSVDMGELSGYHWFWQMDSGDVCQLEMNPSGNILQMKLSGLKEGVDFVTVQCTKTPEATNTEFSLVMGVAVDAQLQVQIQHYEHTQAYTGVSGADSPLAYSWSRNEGVLEFSIRNDLPGQPWYVQSVTETVEASVNNGPNLSTVYLTGLSEGTGQVVLTRNVDHGRITIDLTVDQRGQLTVDNVTMEDVVVQVAQEETVDG